ncbi:MAG: hypothetical protein KJ571_19795 [Bacteroidetes bacterium]|nr:hypothetical protein [Bacteroidota bacterium]
MQTTSILAELIVIGCTALIWCYPVIEKVTEINFSTIMNNSGNIVISLALLYLLGVIVNFIADIFFAKFDDKYSNDYGGKESQQIARTKILLKSTEATNYMTIRRSIVRILRASTFNSIIYSILIFFSMADPIPKLANLWDGIIFLIITFFFLMGYRHTLIGYFKFLKLTEELINADTK